MELRYGVCLKKAVVGLVCVVSTACTWVALSPSGEAVRVAQASDVAECEKKGQTRVSLKADIGGFDRNAEKVRRELETLARNSAARMQANTVVAVGDIEQGEQIFNVYRCTVL